MKQGRTIKRIQSILQAERQKRTDIFVKTACIRSVVLDGEMQLEITDADQRSYYKVSEVAHRQLAEWIKLPVRYYQQLNEDNPSLMEHLLNAWLAKGNEHKLLRICNKTILAVLSSSYFRYDNLELLNLVNNMVNSHRYLRIVSAELEHGVLHIKLIDRRQKEELAEGDTIYAGAVISNSELGLSPIKIETMIYRAKESAAFIFRDQAKRIYHTYRQINNYCLASDITDYDSIEINYEPMEDGIIQHITAILQDSYLVTKAMAVIKCLDALKFSVSHEYPRLIDELSESYSLNQAEKAQIYMKFVNCADQNYLNLLSTLSYKLAATDYSRATELERIAGNMLLSFRQLKTDVA